MNCCVLVLFQWPFLDQISAETKQKSKYNVDEFYFHLKKKIFWKYPLQNSGTNEKFIEHVI